MSPFFTRLLVHAVGKSLNLEVMLNSKSAGERALKLFCSPRKSKLRPVDETFCASADEQVVLQLDGMAIQTYHWKGKGPTILLAHGWESNASRWEELLMDLRAQDFNVVALDAPAHGKSGGKMFFVPLYAAMINEVLVKYPASPLIGHSIGGMAAAFCLWKYPNQNVDKLVVLGSPSSMQGMVTNFRKLLGFNAKVEKSMNTAFEKLFGISTEDAAMDTFAQKIQIPTLWVHDENDDIAPFDTAKKIAAQWPSASFVATKDLGHRLYGQVVVELVRGFLGESS